ncbi:MAG: MoaD/ThiS family protein [Actinobacteria bacterium]|nr:MoaD/ThiS family protein [Actinomycetota bacterium]
MHLFAAARAAVGAATVEAAPGSLGDLLTGLEARYPSFVAVRPRCSFLVDGLAVHGDPSEVLVGAGSTVDVLPPFAGG